MKHWYNKREFWMKREKNKKIATELPDWYSDLEQNMLNSYKLRIQSKSNYWKHERNYSLA
jgi:hypothetical protein